MGDRLLKSRSGDLLVEERIAEFYQDDSGQAVSGTVTMNTDYSGTTTNFVKATGIFTAPRDGILVTTCSIYSPALQSLAAGKYIRVGLKRNGSIISNGPTDTCDVVITRRYAALHIVHVPVSSGDTFSWSATDVTLGGFLDTVLTNNTMSWVML